MSARATGIRSVAVVVPVRNEEALLGASLDAIDAAIDEVRRSPTWRSVEIVIVVVLDDCTDGSASIAREREGVVVVEVSFRCVGAVRAHGTAHALGATRVHPAALWLAHTDGDSRVPREWITSQLDHAATGATVVLGSIRPDPADLTPAQVHTWQLRAESDDALHVYGANLGVRADVYLEAGGFHALAEHEDADLVDRLRCRDARIARAAGGPVVTSARTSGRTPGGFAAYVRENY
ncbi:glycosyltransferase [Marisediminicola sp. LYQ85]|uniref:glycosyltransferase n=1 Tax=Marisediminicola sp. LYQ85 TaxID=3391062 RepID=UPI0039836A15